MLQETCDSGPEAREEEGESCLPRAQACPSSSQPHSLTSSGACFGASLYLGEGTPPPQDTSSSRAHAVDVGSGLSIADPRGWATRLPSSEHMRVTGQTAADGTWVRSAWPTLLRGGRRLAGSLPTRSRASVTPAHRGKHSSGLPLPWQPRSRAVALWASSRCLLAVRTSMAVQSAGKGFELRDGDR